MQQRQVQVRRQLRLRQDLQVRCDHHHCRGEEEVSQWPGGGAARPTGTPNRQQDIMFPVPPAWVLVLPAAADCFFASSCCSAPAACCCCRPVLAQRRRGGSMADCRRHLRATRWFRTLLLHWRCAARLQPSCVARGWCGSGWRKLRRHHQPRPSEQPAGAKKCNVRSRGTKQQLPPARSSCVPARGAPRTLLRTNTLRAPAAVVACSAWCAGRARRAGQTAAS